MENIGFSNASRIVDIVNQESGADSSSCEPGVRDGFPYLGTRDRLLYPGIWDRLLYPGIWGSLLYPGIWGRLLYLGTQGRFLYLGSQSGFPYLGTRNPKWVHVPGNPEPVIHSLKILSTGIARSQCIERVLENIIQDAFPFLGKGTLGNGNADTPSIHRTRIAYRSIVF